MLDFITINEHSSIRVDEGKIIYSDPYNINCAPHDADIILITHSHFDHYSPDDIRKVMRIVYEDNIYKLRIRKL